MRNSIIEIRSIAYHNSSEKLFHPFALELGAVWLDSGRPSNKLGRYDIISAYPFNRLISPKSQPLPHPFVALKTLMADFKMPPLLANPLPFVGGAIGYFAYELGLHLEQLTTQAARDINLPGMVIGLYAWAIIVDHHKQESYLMINHYLTKYQTDWPEVLKKIKKNLSQISQSQNFAACGFELKSEFKTNMTKPEYAAQFQRLKKYLQAGDCYQVNSAQRFSAKVEGAPWAAYQRVRRHVPTPFAAFINLGNQAILCHSPERFLLTRDKHVETKPIKGTRRRDVDLLKDQALAAELTTSEKDRAENIMIVDLLRNDLGKVCEIGSVNVTKLCEVESFPNVHHLVSTITGTLSHNHGPLDLLQACFPGGSITGAPKYRAMQIIDELEPHGRSVYCGAIGYIDVRGHMDTNIAIRTLIWDDNHLHGYAGGGIVIDSDIEAEYQESLDKIGALLEALK